MSKSTLPPGFTTEAALKKAVSDYRTIGLGRDHTLRKIPGLTDHAYRRIVNQLEHGVVPPAPKVDAPPDLDALLIIAKRALRGDRQLTFAALRETLGVSDTVASDIAKKLEKSGDRKSVV